MPATILVFEKRARWRPSLQRELASSSVCIRSCGSLNELQTAVRECQSNQTRCIALLDLSSGLSSVLQFLATTQNAAPQVASITIGAAPHAILEPTLRELGASSFHRLPLRRDRLAAECLRLLRMKECVVKESGTTEKR